MLGHGAVFSSLVRFLVTIRPYCLGLVGPSHHKKQACEQQKFVFAASSRSRRLTHHHSVRLWRMPSVATRRRRSASPSTPTRPRTPPTASTACWAACASTGGTRRCVAPPSWAWRDSSARGSAAGTCASPSTRAMRRARRARNVSASSTRRSPAGSARFSRTRSSRTATRAARRTDAPGPRMTGRRRRSRRCRPGRRCSRCARSWSSPAPNTPVSSTTSCTSARCGPPSRAPRSRPSSSAR